MPEYCRPVAAFFRLLAASAVLGAFCYWMVKVPVALYETSLAARLEIQTSPAVIQAPMTGRIVDAHLVLNKIVNAGDILVRRSGVQPHFGFFRGHLVARHLARIGRTLQ